MEGILEIPVDMGTECPLCKNTSYHLTQRYVICSKCNTAYHWSEIVTTGVELIESVVGHYFESGMRYSILVNKGQQGKAHRVANKEVELDIGGTYRIWVPLDSIKKRR